MARQPTPVIRKDRVVKLKMFWYGLVLFSVPLVVIRKQLQARIYRVGNIPMHGPEGGKSWIKNELPPFRCSF